MQGAQYSDQGTDFRQTVCWRRSPIRSAPLKCLQGSGSRFEAGAFTRDSARMQLRRYVFRRSGHLRRFSTTKAPTWRPRWSIIRRFGDREAGSDRMSQKMLSRYAMFSKSEVTGTKPDYSGSPASCSIGCCGLCLASELSVGRHAAILCFCTAALLTPRPPELMVLDEPETSLHS